MVSIYDLKHDPYWIKRVADARISNPGIDITKLKTPRGPDLLNGMNKEEEKAFRKRASQWTD